VDLRDVLSLDAFAADLQPADRTALYAMLPAVETRDAAKCADMFRCNMHFLSSLNLYRSLLTSGAFDPDYQSRARSRRRRVEGWTGAWLCRGVGTYARIAEAKEREHEAFYGQRLVPVPADEAQVTKWHAFDEALLAEAERRKAVAREAGG
jgi:hypothetical protein